MYSTAIPLFLANLCEKAWIYDRVPGYELVGYDQRVLNNVLTRMECQELCLEDTLLPCRSCEYNYANKTCHLSQETRRTQPSAYSCLLYTSPSPRDLSTSRMPSSA